jgi:thiamine biosynthesis lipoprotein
MGTTVTVLAPAGAEQHAGVIVEALFAEWEQVLSRFRPDSELSYLNARAGSPVIAGELLWAVLTAALDAARSTGGIYDPLLLRQLEAAGYDRTFADVPGDQPPSLLLPRPGGAWRLIRRDARARAVTLPAGTALDFGGLAKGMAVDAALARLVAAGLPQAAVEAGGDLSVHGHPSNRHGWPVAIRLPTGARGVSLYRGALATSSRSYRRWRQGETERHHILDPRTGLPADSGLWSVSVTASSCAQADVAAKTAFILGPQDGRAFLLRYGLPALLVWPDGATEPVGPWPAADEAVP